MPRRAFVFALTLLAGLLGPAAASRAQFSEFTIDPALGPYPTSGPGGYISNGFGYRSYGPNGYGPYWPGLYFPPNDMHNGPNPAYSPLYSALIAAPPPNAPSDPASWRLQPSLPFTGNSRVKGWLHDRRR